MAAKENQGLHAFIIVLSILVIGLGVGLLLVNNAKKTAIARADTAEKSASTASSEKAKSDSERDNFKEWMGIPSTDTYETATKLFEEDKTRLMASLPEESRKYRTALDSIAEENRKLSLNESKAKEDVKQLTARLLAVEGQRDQRVKEMEGALKKASDDAAAEKAGFEQFRTKMEAENAEIGKNLAELQASHDEALAKLGTEKTSLSNTVATLENSIDVLKAAQPDADPFAQPADGRISYVNQRYKKVWIDLGSADGLRPQVTFSVIAEGATDAELAEQKGTIEVVRVIDAHMSEARITSDESTDPLMPGDRIYSLVWDRGRQVGFGIAGFIDVDGDGKSDLDLVKRIIAASNGRVDAAPDAEGNKQGELKVSTRYLVLGRSPDDPIAAMQRFATSYKSLTEDAENLGVETIRLEEFLKLMGWKLDTQSTPMDSSATAADFPPEARGQEMPRKTRQPAGVFKKRLPSVSEF